MLKSGSFMSLYPIHLITPLFLGFSIPVPSQTSHIKTQHPLQHQFIHSTRVTMTNTLYQYSILSALMKGLCKNGLPASSALKKGTHGLGTVPHLNGEVIILDGVIYHFPPDGPLRELQADDTLPFCMVTDFVPTLTKSLPTLSMSTLVPALHPLLPAQQNRFLSVLIRGSFDIRFRVIAAQTEGESLGELAKKAKVYTVDGVRGTIFGFWSPAFSTGFGVSGFHLHFLSGDRGTAGHVLEFQGNDVELEAASVGEYRVDLPLGEEFNSGVIGCVADTEVHEAEGGA